MSTRKGAKKHQNSVAYNPSKHGQSRRVKQAAAASLGGICARCKEKIEWKKKFDKYKPLSAPKKCILCGERRVRQAYHQICQECAEEKMVCAKCNHQEEIVERFPPDKRQEVRKEAEFRAGLRQMRERERRTALRDQARGKLTGPTGPPVESEGTPLAEDLETQGSMSDTVESDCSTSD